MMLTGDENIIDIDVAVFWRIRDAGEFLFNTRNPESTVKSAAESVMREVIGRTPIQPALTEARAQIEQEVRRGTQAIMDQYHAGIEITQVQLQKVDPPAQVIDAFRDVQAARADLERLQNEAQPMPTASMSASAARPIRRPASARCPRATCARNR